MQGELPVDTVHQAQMSFALTPREEEVWAAEQGARHGWQLAVDCCLLWRERGAVSATQCARAVQRLHALES
jgi:hypothetical protein